jgi:uncharacterized membrane protein YkoI
MRRRTLIGYFAMTLCVTVLSVTSPTTLAKNKQSDPIINQSQAVQKAQKKVKGRVIKVDKRNNKYRVKLLQKSGKVISVEVDGRSGQVRRLSGKD